VAESASSAFERLHPTLKEALYRMRWTKLHKIQVDAIHEILAGGKDLLISARTAGGKTEAAFLPILSRLAEERAPGVQSVYVGPLKALINDQFRRLEELCLETEIPVHKWHGDVSSAAKHRLLNQPAGVLLITPESIESLLVNHPHRLSALFHVLRFVVIDELHSFIGTERGAHLRSLLCRLASKGTASPRLVALSATLGPDLEAAKRWLRPRSPNSVGLIEGTDKKTIQLKVNGYLLAAPAHAEEASDRNENSDPPSADLERDVFDAFHGKTALVFANNKRTIERIADFAKREAARRGQPDLFRVHHGSLSKVEREDTEDLLRSDSPTATFCSSTLEMGIDVGNVKIVGQIGAPWSVNSFAQRLGRSGRRDGEPSVLRVFIEADEPDQHTELVKRLFPELLQAAAMTELHLERWCEPLEVDRLHLSTLIQQILSVITERGGATAKELFDCLGANGGFAAIDQGLFIQVLRAMGAADLVEQTPEGPLISGLRGEKIVRHHDFYVAFMVTEEYRVSHVGHAIGSVEFLPDYEKDRHLILAGRRWRILDVDHERKVISVVPSPGGRVPSFSHRDGGDLHPRIRVKMREILARDDVPLYLDNSARQMLTMARLAAREAGVLDQAFVQDGSTVYWFTWTGSRIQRALFGLGAFFGGLKADNRGIALAFEKIEISQVQDVYRRFFTQCPDCESLALKFEPPAREKYEAYLPEHIRARSFAQERLDLEGALDLIRACSS
jgi:ATP-dependent helicase Lhr and Lhr-like helicase